MLFILLLYIVMLPLPWPLLVEVVVASFLDVLVRPIVVVVIVAVAVVVGSACVWRRAGWCDFLTGIC